jgi:hypothetical protein
MMFYYSGSWVLLSKIPEEILTQAYLPLEEQAQTLQNRHLGNTKQDASKKTCLVLLDMMYNRHPGVVRW